MPPITLLESHFSIMRNSYRLTLFRNRPFLTSETVACILKKRRGKRMILKEFLGNSTPGKVNKDHETSRTYGIVAFQGLMRRCSALNVMIYCTSLTYFFS